MLDLSSLDQFGRRDFLRGIGAAGLLPFAFGGEKAADGLPVCPLTPARTDRFDTLVAILRAQIDSLWCGHQGDSACEVGQDFLTYASYLPRRLQQGISVALLWLEWYAVKHEGKKLSNMCPSEVRRVLNQGEHPRCEHDPPQIEWCTDYLLHTAVSGIAMIGRLVIHSRRASRDYIGLSWSDQCNDVSRSVSVPAYPMADLSEHYDVCIIGSGAGGATVAKRFAESGYRVLILDAGDFVSPDALIQKVPNPAGGECLAPPRSDEVLYRLYKTGAGQIAGGLSPTQSKLDLILPHRRKKIRPKQTINVAQAEVFGGGPYVNNAIHLPIRRETYETWGSNQPLDVPFERLDEVMQNINAELGVNTIVTTNKVSDRSLRFKRGCDQLGEVCEPLPVSIRDDCIGCGSDNSVDSFGDHIGGVHPFKERQPNSFLTAAMNAPFPAAASYRTRASHVRVVRDEAGALKAAGVDVTRVEDDGRRVRSTVTADQYVIAAGVGATTKIAADTLAHAGLHNRHLGRNLTGNIGTAMYAMYEKPIWPSGTDNPEPGITQCFLVDRRTAYVDGEMVEEPALENWFHFPGTVALALTGWFNEYAEVMRKFNHLSMAGIVIPTKVRRSNYVDRCGDFNLAYDQEEFELLLRGLRRIARIYFASADPDDGVTLYLPTKSILLRHGRPIRVRSMQDFEWALCEIRRRGPAFLNLLCTHPQGGSGLGTVIDNEGFRLQSEDGCKIENLMIADASVFPAGCDINPQLTVKALATIAARRMMQRMAG